MGMIIGSQGARNISVHHNLFAHNHERNPLIQTSGLVDVVNNVVYDAGGTPILFSDEYGKVTANLVGNIQKDGPDSETGKYMISVQSVGGYGIGLFVQGSIAPRRPDQKRNQLVVIKTDSRRWVVPDRFIAPPITTASAFSAYEQVLAEVGATIGLDPSGGIFPRLDEVDQRIIADVKNVTGGIINDPSEVGGWPALAPGTVASDSDQDGMPDEWEQLYRFDPADPTDGPEDRDADGYTNAEEYLNTTRP